MEKKKLLFVIGSLNQTTQLHQVSKYLEDEFDCYFTQFFPSNRFLKWCLDVGVFDRTIMGLKSNFRKASKAYVDANGLREDYMGLKYKDEYEMVVVCNDLVMPDWFDKKKTVFVQEGMIDPLTIGSKIIKWLKLPYYLAVGTSLNGASNRCDIVCTASMGYSNYLNKMGVDRGKLFVTGIPNFDNLVTHLDNDFEYKDYVMVATSDSRETFRIDNRVSFIKSCVRQVEGRKLLFKLHPNEDFDRANDEIMKHTPPGTLVFQQGNTNDMIANCKKLITQYSTVVYVGLILGKEVSSYFPLELLKRLKPIQNGGASAKNIANICRGFLKWRGEKSDFANYCKDNINFAESFPPNVLSKA